MRTVYATAFEVRADADVALALDYVGRWIHEWYQRQRLPVDVLENLTAGDVDVAPAEGHKLSIRHHTTEQFPNQQLVDVRWEYPDQYDKSLGWVVSLSFLRTPRALVVSLDVAVTGLQLFVAPARIKLGSPRLVRDIARLRSVFIGEYSYNLTPEVVSAEDIELLVPDLSDQARPVPVVLISRRLQDDTPLVDATALSDRLAGVAKVYELADKWAAFRLTEELGKPLSCFAGAVRIYWPRFSDEDDPFAHPLWMPWQFKDAETAERTVGDLSRLVFEAAAFRHVEPSSITLFRQAAEREAREALRIDNKKSVDELLDDLVEMEAKLLTVEAARAELALENETLRANAAALAAHSAWTAQPQSTIAEQPAAHPETSAPASIEEAVRLAEERAKHLKFLPSAHASAADSPYRHPERVLQALTALDEVASMWAGTVVSGKPAGSVRQLFRQRGFEYADDISRTSKGKWGEEYVAEYKGQQLDISPHITIGAKQADSCLSIHWAWDKEDKVAVVAHVGRHKSNTKT